MTLFSDNINDEPYDMPFDDSDSLEELLDEDAGEENPTSVSYDDKDIDFNLCGYTFDTFYLGANFDDKGNIIQDKLDAQRIDNAMGLHKMNPAKFSSKEEISKALGTIRRHLEYSSNTKIID
jgi:hypothetical protein